MNHNSWLSIPSAVMIYFASCCISNFAVALDDAYEDYRPVVAVLDIRLDGVDFSEPVVQRLTEYLSSQVAGNNAFMVVPRDQTARALVEQKVKAQDPCYGSCQVRLGGAVGATKILESRVVLVGTSCAFVADVFDIQSETKERSETIKPIACNEGGVIDGIEQAAARLGQRIGVSSGSEVIGRGTVVAGVTIDHGESIVNVNGDETGLLFVETDPPRAPLVINGVMCGTSPYQEQLKVGKYLITASLNSYYHNAEQEVILTTAGATVKLTLPPAFGTLKVDSTPPDADVLVDDKPVGTTPYTDTHVKSGEHLVEVKKDLYKTERRSITISDGLPSLEDFHLEQDFGAIRVTTDPSGAKILLDGKDVGETTPAELQQIATGIHSIAVELDGYGRRVEQVRVANRSTSELPIVLEPKLGLLMVMTTMADGTPCQGTISIDGIRVGSTPWKGNILAKEHRVEAACGSETKALTVDIEHNAQNSLRIQLEPPSKIEWIEIQGGSFMMGRKDYGPEGEPVHKVTIQSFELSKTEVTVAQYSDCVEAGACSAPHWDDGTCEVSEGDDGTDLTNKLPQELRDHDLPVVCVDWNQANAYAKWVGGRLPSEAEWEYAARSGGIETKYPWGPADPTCDSVVDNYVFEECDMNNTPQPPCSRVAGNSKQGVCDLAGNVAEWVQDDWHDSYRNAPKDGRAWLTPKRSLKVFRGSGWDWGVDFMDARGRHPSGAAESHKGIGIRVAR